jgi:hypothetical protein
VSAAAHRAPRCAVPALAAYLVVHRGAPYLRGLDDAAFSAIARASDRFWRLSTAAPFALAACFFGGSAFEYLVIAAGLWGTVSVRAVGVPVALERRRRRGQIG